MNHWRHGALAALGLALASCAPTTPPGPGIDVKQVSPTPGAASTSRPATGAATPDANGTAAATPTPGPTPTPATLSADQDTATLDQVSGAAGSTVTPRHHVALATSEGEVDIALFSDQAPQAVAKFLLATTSGIYDGTTFHRVIPSFVAQGGDPNSKLYPFTDARIGSGGWGDPVPDTEFTNGLHHLKGSVAFAHSGQANSSYVQFYICLAPQPSLDGKYIVFGQVTKGFDAVLRLKATQPGANAVQPDVIRKATQSD